MTQTQNFCQQMLYPKDRDREREREKERERERHAERHGKQAHAHRHEGKTHSLIKINGKGGRSGNRRNYKMGKQGFCH